MNTKAESFKSYIDEKKIDIFEIDNFDKEGTTVFRSYITVSGQQLPTVLIINDSDFITVRVQIASQVINDNKPSVIDVLNSENASYRYFKLYISNKDTLLLDVQITSSTDSIDGDLVYKVFGMVISYLENAYRKIMKAVWS